jgi:hypothetical protein
MTDNLEHIDKNDLKALAEPLQQFTKENELYHNLLHLCRDSITINTQLPNVIDVLAKVQGESEEFTKSKANAIKKSDLAKSEIENGFPFLYNQASLMLYSHLEGAIKRFVTEFFKINGAIETINELSKIKITISEFLKLDETERLEYLFQQYEKTVTIGLQYGVTRFETLLKPIGFAGKVDLGIQKVIFELSQVRNNIIHRGGFADKHLINSCPWLKYKIGDAVKITQAQYEKYHAVVFEYVILIIIRLGEKRGQDMSEFKKSVDKESEE